MTQIPDGPSSEPTDTVSEPLSTQTPKSPRIRSQVAKPAPEPQNQPDGTTLNPPQPD